MKIKKFIIDLDGTLAYWRKGDNDISKIGDPLPGAVEFVNTLASDGSKITIFTRRMSYDALDGDLPDDELTKKEINRNSMFVLIQEWLDKHGFIWHDIYVGQGKPDGTAFIDDRGVSCRPQDNPNAYVEAIKYINEKILK